MTDGQTTLVTAGSLVFALCLQPIYGALSDRIGRKPLLIWFGVTGTIFTIPLLYALQSTKSAIVAFLLIAAAWLIVAGYTSINAVVKAELFPTKVRATGVGAALRHHRFDLRRDGRIDRALVQVDRPRDLVLLLPDGRHRDVAGRLRDPCATPSTSRRWTATNRDYRLAAFSAARAARITLPSV